MPPEDIRNLGDLTFTFNGREIRTMNAEDVVMLSGDTRERINDMLNTVSMRYPREDIPTEFPEPPLFTIREVPSLDELDRSFTLYNAPLINQVQLDDRTTLFYESIEQLIKYRERIDKHIQNHFKGK